MIHGWLNFKFNFPAALEPSSLVVAAVEFKWRHLGICFPEDINPPTYGRSCLKKERENATFEPPSGSLHIPITREKLSFPSVVASVARIRKCRKSARLPRSGAVSEHQGTGDCTRE